MAAEYLEASGACGASGIASGSMRKVSERYLSCIWKAFGRHLRTIWETSGRLEVNRGSQEDLSIKIIPFLNRMQKFL